MYTYLYLKNPNISWALDYESYFTLIHSAMNENDFTPVTFLQHMQALHLHQSRNFNQNCLFMYASPREGFRLQFSQKTVLLSKLFI